MTLNRKLFSTAFIFLLMSLACAEADSFPPTPSVPPRLPSPTPAQNSGPTPPDTLEQATIAKVIDGDTIELVDGRRVRYIGINTPERDQPYYNEASEANRQLVEGLRVGLETDQDSFDQYGRTLAYVWANGKMVNLEVVRQGYANIFTVPPNVKYEMEFLAAERQARAAKRGLWAGADVALKITDLHANAPGNDNENPNGEWIEVTNQGSEPVTLTNYTLKDAANHIYTFDQVTLPSGSAFKLYSGNGQDQLTELYWGYEDESVWNNDTDTAFLRDAEGRLVDVYAY